MILNDFNQIEHLSIHFIMMTSQHNELITIKTY